MVQCAPRTYSGSMPWKRPSEPVRELIRQCAQITVNPRAEWLDELDAEVLSASPPIAGDPELAAAVSRSNRANMYFWGTANVRDPGAPVAPNTGPEPMNIAREVARRGLTAFTLDAYRVGEAVAWRRLMEIAFELTSDPGELHELLDVCSRSISAFIDGTLAGIAAQIDQERDDLTRGTHAERRETVALDPRRRPHHSQEGRGTTRLRLDRPAYGGGHMERRFGRRHGPPGWGRRGARTCRRSAAADHLRQHGHAMGVDTESGR